jgi:hypothetical protein
MKMTGDSSKSLKGKCHPAPLRPEEAPDTLMAMRVLPKKKSTDTFHSIYQASIPSSPLKKTSII